MTHALDSYSPCHKLLHLLGPLPSSVMYFMDGPLEIKYPINSNSFSHSIPRTRVQYLLLQEQILRLFALKFCTFLNTLCLNWAHGIHE